MENWKESKWKAEYEELCKTFKNIDGDYKIPSVDELMRWMIKTQEKAEELHKQGTDFQIINRILENYRESFPINFKSNWSHDNCVNECIVIEMVHGTLRIDFMRGSFHSIGYQLSIDDELIYP